MGIVTTRRLEELQAECDRLGIPTPPDPSREQLFDLLRAHTGVFDPELEIDPMKAADLKKEIDWSQAGPARFAKLPQLSPTNPEWIAEPKLDGVRLRMVLGEAGNTLITGRRSVKTFCYTQRQENFPHLASATLPEWAGTILDGELIAPQPKIQTHTGTWTNSLLNASVALTNSNPLGAQRTQQRFGKAQFWIFDVMTLKGESVMEMPWSHRRVIVENLVTLLQEAHPECEIRTVPVLDATAENVQASIDNGFEGVMLKRRDGRYEAGKRSKVWLKVKTMSTADAFIVNFAPGENGNEGLVGSLELAVWQPVDEMPVPEGTEPRMNAIDGRLCWLRKVAQVGNLTEEFRREITAFAGTPDATLDRKWVGKVCEFMSQGIGKNGRARHAHLVRLRPDKSMLDCMADQLDVFPAV